MQPTNKALAGLAVMIALAGCASTERKQQTTTAQNDAAYQQQKASMEQERAQLANVCKQAAGQAAKESKDLAPPSCNCSCGPKGSTSSVQSGKTKITAKTTKGGTSESVKTE